MEDLTAEQVAVVNRDAPFVVSAPAGSGKTTALRHRYARLAGSGTTSASRILLVARTRPLASRLRRELLPHLRGGFDSLPITTVWGLAFDLVARHDGAVSLLSSADHRALIANLLAAEQSTPALWPTLGSLVGRPAFAGHAAATLSRLDAALADNHTILARAEASGTGTRWRELLEFRERVESACRRLGVYDGSALLRHAVRTLDADGVLALTRDRFDHVLVDDADALAPAALTLLTRVAGGALVATSTGATGTAALPSAGEANGTSTFDLAVVHLTRTFRQAAAGELIECRHPSTEPEAIAAELLAAAERGVAWSEMAVLSAGGDTAPTARALARHGIPIEPARRWVHLVDSSLREVVGAVRASGTRGTQLLDAAHDAFAAELGDLVRPPGETVSAVDDRVLDEAVSFLRELSAFVRVHPSATIDAYLASREGELEVNETIPDDPSEVGGVTVTTIAAAGGREWPLVVLSNCVEGALPRLVPSPGFFDTALAAGPRPTAVERHRVALERERARFATGESRATTTLLATAAPEPGVLVSRFVDGWPRRAARVALDAPARPPMLSRSAGAAPVWPDGILRLSATQLDTYEDCPLKYALRYAAGVRTEAGLHADLGTVVHDVLARFLDPAAPKSLTRERLLEIADECWRDDIAPYRPQVEEARRDYYDMLERWWEEEGVAIAAGAIEVLATEYPFDIEVGPHRVMGKIDRIDRLGPDAGGGLRVLDYKTGKTKPRQEDVAANVQLATYHLAAIRDETIASWGRPRALRLLYVRSMTPYDQEITDDHDAATEARILEAAADIVAERFEPSVSADCDHCELHRLCPLWPEGLEIAQI